jgi:membrane protease YdiL (CAAX protease family)
LAYVMLNRRPLLCFYLLAFAITWSVWLPEVAVTQGWLRFRIPAALDGLAYFWGPPLAAVVVTASAEGRAGLRALFARLLAWRVGLRWYVFALLWRPAILGAVLVLLFVLGAAPAAAGAWYTLIPTFLLWVLLLLVANVGEEIGWRGYALPHLQARVGPLAASVTIGLLGGLWHLPAFFILGHPQYGTVVLPFMVWMIAITIVFTWIYNNTSGSLLPVALLHAAINAAGAVFPPAPLLLEVGVTLIAAIGVVILARPRLSLGYRGCPTTSVSVATERAG